MIELRHLRYYVAVAEELHFGRAAERLRMAQSPLSHQVRQLERDVGTELISRGHHVVGLTDAGEAFLEAARNILADVEEAVHLARRASRGEVGTLSVGYVGEVTADLLPLSLRTFKEQYGDVELSVREGTTGYLLDGLRDRSVDIAFVRSPRVVDDLDYEQLVEEALMLALPASAGEPRRDPRLTDLREEHFVLPSYVAAQGLRRDVETACRDAGFSPKVARETSPLTAVLLLVAAGVGASLRRLLIPIRCRGSTSSISASRPRLQPREWPGDRATIQLSFTGSSRSRVISRGRTRERRMCGPNGTFSNALPRRPTTTPAEPGLGEGRQQPPSVVLSTLEREGQRSGSRGFRLPPRGYAAA